MKQLIATVKYAKVVILKKKITAVPNEILKKVARINSFASSKIDWPKTRYKSIPEIYFNPADFISLVFCIIVNEEKVKIEITKARD